jgi:hypothetical protein
VLDDLDELVVRLGRQLAKDAEGVDQELYARLAERLTDAEIVLLTASGAMMVATKVLNRALRVDRRLSAALPARPERARSAPTRPAKGWG